MNLQMIEQSPLVLGAGKMWPEATSGEFLSAIRDSNLPGEAFQRWLVQDYAFAKGLAAFQAVAVAKTPRPAQKVLIAGLSALDAELDWFSVAMLLMYCGLMVRRSDFEANESIRTTRMAPVVFFPLRSQRDLPAAKTS